MPLRQLERYESLQQDMIAITEATTHASATEIAVQLQHYARSLYEMGLLSEAQLHQVTAGIDSQLGAWAMAGVATPFV